MKVKKGSYGYVRSEKRVRLLRTILIFAVDFAIFFLGYYLNQGDRKNIYSVIAAVGCIPGAMSAVGLIMMLMRKSVSPDLHAEIEKHTAGLQVLYELYLTTQEKNLYLDAAIVNDGYVIALSTEEKPQSVYTFMETHIRKSLLNEGCPVTVKIFHSPEKFLERADQMAAKRAAAGGTADNPQFTEKEQVAAAVLCQLAL